MRTALLALLLAAAPAAACSFCGDGMLRRPPLRKHFADAVFVARGNLKNPRPAADGVGGTTEFHVAAALKADKPFAGTTLVVVPRYIPIVGDTPNDYLLFCTTTDGKLDVTHGISATPRAAEYLKKAAALDPADPAKSLAFFFAHLDSADETVSSDAFLEFARAPDRDIQKAAASLDRKKLRGWLADPKTPTERIGVYGMLLGLCGTRDDARFLAGELGRKPLPDRTASAFGGLAAGLVQLDPAAGWAALDGVLGGSGPYTERLAAINTLRYLQATRWADAKPRLLARYKALLADGDFADLAADDLRRWACWDLTADVLAPFDRPTHAAPTIRRGIVRYALACPDGAATAFVAAARARDPELVRKVEEANKLYEKK